MVDIEARLVAWLPEQTGFPWFADVPACRPKRFGTVERTGGGVGSVVVDSPTVALQVWGESRADTARMAYTVMGAIPQFAYEPGIRKASVNSVYNFPDEQGDNPRYQVVADFKTV